VAPTVVAPVPPVGSVTTARSIFRSAPLGRNLLFLEIPSTPSKKALEIGYWVRQKRGMAPSLDRELERPVQPGQFISPEPFRLTLPQAHPGDPLAVLDFVVQRNRIAPQVNASGKALQLLSLVRLD
jgi:hypothetical protein